jgi:hypothetical protein
MYSTLTAVGLDHGSFVKDVDGFTRASGMLKNAAGGGLRRKLKLIHV